MLDATPLLRLYAHYRMSRLAALDPETVQRNQLLKLVARAKETRFGADHAFGRVRNVADYQDAVPLRRYEDFWKTYWEGFPVLDGVTWPGRIPYFANTSGTATGTTKHIPVSWEMTKANRRASLDLLTHHVVNRPHSRVLGGKNFMLGGGADLTECAPGVAMGDLSGVAVNEVPWWARSRYFPPRDLALLSNWEEKVQRLAGASLKEDIRTIAGIPSWLLLFFERLHALRPDTGGRLVEYYPNLELLVHGGVNFAPYRKRFDELLQGSHAETREVYPASEGFIAVADRGPGEGLRLLLDNGLFFEFVPLDELGAANPARHWIATAQLNVNYALIVTSCAGLWSYIIGDTVRFVDRKPPRILVSGRTSYSLSAFGEHLTGEEIEGAAAAAAAAIGASLTDFSVSPVYPAQPGEVGYHLYAVEFSAAVSAEDAHKFAKAVDKKLCALNEDYAAHREGEFGMLAPRVKILAPGTFAKWMESRGKLGGQNKAPRVILDSGLFQSLASGQFE